MNPIKKVEDTRLIPIELIRPNPYQPRKTFNDEGLDELKQSIQNYGVIQPILVRKLGDGFELIAGERRLRASKLAGLKEIPAIVKELPDRELAVITLVENLQREDLNYLEEAEGYQKLIQDYNLTQEELAHRIGKSQSTIANKLRLLRLPASVKAIISQEMLSERHARALLRLPDETSQLRVLQEIQQKNLNVRETDNLVEQIMCEIAASADKRAGAQSAQETPVPKRRVIKLFKDVRIFLNTIRKAVSIMQDAGIDVHLQEKDREDHMEVSIIIRSHKIETQKQ